MALNRYIVTSAQVLPAGAFTLDASSGLRFGTGSTANGAGNYGSGGGVIVPKGRLLLLDPAGQVFAAIGAGNLALVTPAQETGGFYGTAN